MLKIGTSKVGGVVTCPRCQMAVVVPLNSSPQAEQLYQALKKKRSAEVTAPPPPEEEKVSEPAVPESAWNDLGENVNEADLNRWIDEFWAKSSGSQHPPLPSIPVTAAPVVTDEVAVVALQKRYKLTLTLLYVSATVAFLAGIVFGIFIRGMYVPPLQPMHIAGMTGNNAEANEMTGTLFYLNENSERRPDVDAVIIGLPMENPPSPLFSCQGLRPGDILNNDTVHQIQEMGGMYGSADVNGSFSLQYRAGVRYFVIMISAHQMREGGVIKPSIEQELRRYFRDPALFAGNALNADEFVGTGGKHHFLPHVFERDL